jgi:hypothetical protein
VCEPRWEETSAQSKQFSDLLTLCPCMTILSLLPALSLCVLALAQSAPSKVVVLAQGRSGSSFLSSWFSAERDTLYFLEPCSNVFLANAKADATGQECIAHVNHVLRCELGAFLLGADQASRIPKAAAGFKGWCV